jgi:hypothetical protein
MDWNYWNLFMVGVGVPMAWGISHVVLRNVVWMRGIHYLKSNQKKPLPGEGFFLTSPLQSLVEMGVVLSFTGIGINIIISRPSLWARLDYIVPMLLGIGIIFFSLFVALTIPVQRIKTIRGLIFTYPFTLIGLKEFTDTPPYYWKYGSPHLVGFDETGWKERYYLAVTSLYYIIWFIIFSFIFLFIILFLIGFIASILR